MQLTGDITSRIKYWNLSLTQIAPGNVTCKKKRGWTRLKNNVCSILVCPRMEGLFYYYMYPDIILNHVPLY